MPKQTPKLNSEWIRETRASFKHFLDMTTFPHPARNGTRGSAFDYPEWLIMFIAILAVKGQVKTYLGTHRLVLQYWQIIAEGLNLQPISESQRRERLKKSCHTPRRPAAFILQLFPHEGFD
jgi:hypothetical protein